MAARQERFAPLNMRPISPLSRDPFGERYHRYPKGRNSTQFAAATSFSSLTFSRGSGFLSESSIDCPICIS
jgi:hypothetical protein